MTCRPRFHSLSKDRKGQMPFSLIAIILVLLSIISAAVIANMQQSSEGAGITVEGLERLDALSQEARENVEQLAFQAVLDICSGETSNESKLSTTFRSTLENVLSAVYPKAISGHRTEVNASDVRLSFLRLSLSDEAGGWEGTYLPAYIGLCGNFEVKVSSEDGNLTRIYEVSTDAKVPWPLLKDRTDSFISSVSGDLGELSSMTKAMLDTLSAYRSLQGWGVATSSMGEGLDDLISKKDVVNALDLGLILLQVRSFRNVTPCFDISTDHMNGDEAWAFIRDEISEGGNIDPADIFLGLYGCSNIDWSEIFSTALYASLERTSLRFLENLHIIDILNVFESISECVVETANDVIDFFIGRDLVEEQYKDWIITKFHEAGIPDTLYRLFGAGGPEDTISTPEASLTLVDDDGQNILLQTTGVVSMDFPEVDIMDWGGWGDLKEQYEKNTNVILENIRQSLAEIAETISNDLYIPDIELKLDPRDGLSFIDEVRSGLNAALADKEEWLRPAIVAGERYSSSSDPLAEATYDMFVENIDAILGRSTIIDSMTRSLAEQILSDIQEANPEISLPWDANVRLIEQAIIDDDDWTMMEELSSTYDYLVYNLVQNFQLGMYYVPSSNGHSGSFISQIIANTGDPLIGLSAVISDDVESLLNDISGCMSLRGDVMEIELSCDDAFILSDDRGLTYAERLDVEVIYPSSKDAEQDLCIMIDDPSTHSSDSGVSLQVHDTDLINSKWASYQSVWGLFYSGALGFNVIPAGEIGELLPMEVDMNVPLSASIELTLMSGLPLSGVHYRNINTLYDNMVNIMENILRPLIDGIEILSSGLQNMYRMLADAVKRLIDMGTKALDALVETIQTMVEKLQDFIRSSVIGFGASLVENAANALGERTISLSLFGFDLIIKIKPKDLAFSSVGIPVSFSLSTNVGSSSISVTSRLTKGEGDYGFLTNATLTGDDWAVCMVIDPFMDMFSHIVEIRGVLSGACIELVLPEVVTYQEATFALSDIPGMAALLSNIPTPIPGLKGSVDAGLTIKVLSGRSDGVVINEYELNPAGEDQGNEWVELFNPTGEAVDLTGWALQTSHGIRSLGFLGDSLLMPKGRLVYYFDDQALDNMGSGFPFEESIVLLDNNGRRIDSTPFTTDYWNDGRTWQRSQDGADRWEFKDGTKGARNGFDAFTLLDLTEVQNAFLSSVTESLNQLTSVEMSMETVSGVLSSALLHLSERLAATILGQQVEMSLFVEVAGTDYSSSAKVGMRMALTLQCGTVSNVLRSLMGSVSDLVTGFGNPYGFGTGAISISRDLWVGVYTFASLGLPDMISSSFLDIEVQYVTSLEANIAALSSVLGLKDDGWGVNGGICIEGIPSGLLSLKNLPESSLVSIWLCKASVSKMGA